MIRLRYPFAAVVAGALALGLEGFESSTNTAPSNEILKTATGCTFKKDGDIMTAEINLPKNNKYKETLRPQVINRSSTIGVGSHITVFQAIGSYDSETGRQSAWIACQVAGRILHANSYAGGSHSYQNGTMTFNGSLIEEKTIPQTAHLAQN